MSDAHTHTHRERLATTTATATATTTATTTATATATATALERKSWAFVLCVQLGSGLVWSGLSSESTSQRC